MAEPLETTSTRPRSRSEIVTMLMARLDSSAVPRSAVSAIVQLLEEEGFLTYQRPVAERPLDAADAHLIVRLIEDAGFRLTRRPEVADAIG